MRRGRARVARRRRPSHRARAASETGARTKPGGVQRVDTCKLNHLDTEETLALIPVLELLSGVVGLGPLDKAIGADHCGPERVPVVRKVSSDSDNLLLCLRVRWGARISLEVASA